MKIIIIGKEEDSKVIACMIAKVFDQVKIPTKLVTEKLSDEEIRHNQYHCFDRTRNIQGIVTIETQKEIES